MEGSTQKESFLEHLDKRFDRLDRQLEHMDTKLDDHLGRISKAETELSWIKGAGKLAVTLIISALGFLAQFLRSHG